MGINYFGDDGSNPSGSTKWEDMSELNSHDVTTFKLTLKVRRACWSDAYPPLSGSIAKLVKASFCKSDIASSNLARPSNNASIIY